MGVEALEDEKRRGECDETLRTTAALFSGDFGVQL
jgi:hypothetical protein